MPATLTPSSLTPGQRAARRGVIGARPGQPGWEEAQLVDLVEAMQRNPYVRTVLGDRIKVKVVHDPASRSLRFELREVA